MTGNAAPGKRFNSRNTSTRQERYAASGIAASILVALLILILPAPEGLSVEGQRMAALFAVALILFVTEAIPIAVTSVLILMLQPVMGITDNIRDAFSSWMTPVFFFVLVMFVLAQAVNATGLARRFALWLLTLAGSDSRKIIMVFVIGAGVMSLIMSDVAACAIFMAIGLGIIEKMNLKPGSRFAKALMLGIPIGALIGGIGTPAGSSINLLGLDQLETYGGVRVRFFDWMMIGMPMVVFLLPLASWIVSRFCSPEMVSIDKVEEIRQEHAKAGPISMPQIKVLVILSAMVVLWILSTWYTALDIYMVGIGGAVAMFLPGIKVVKWKEVQEGAGWDSMLLIGGVTSLGSASVATGLAQWIVDVSLGSIADWQAVWIIALISAFTVVMHLILPVNPAIVTVLIPPLTILAKHTGVNPALYALPVAFTASCAFLLPLDAVPLLTYSKGYYKMFDMFPPGVVISVLWIVLMAAVLTLIAPLLGYI
ncbi:MAG: DASS family sodium-coupled anion symporter [Acidobacteriota bacterium]